MINKYIIILLIIIILFIFKYYLLASIFILINIYIYIKTNNRNQLKHYAPNIIPQKIYEIIPEEKKIYENKIYNITNIEYTNKNLTNDIRYNYKNLIH